MSLDYDEYLRDFKNLLTDNRLPNTSKVWNPIVAYQRDKYLTPDELKLNVLNSRRVHQVLDEVKNLYFLLYRFFFKQKIYNF